MRMLASVLVLLAVAGVGRADEDAVVKELGNAGVRVFWMGRFIGNPEALKSRKFSPNHADFSKAQNVNALVDSLCELPDLTDLNFAGSDVTNAGLKKLTGLSVRYLGLSGCPGMTDAGLDSLARMESCRCLTSTARV